jgi:hypothetical protein
MFTESGTRATILRGQSGLSEYSIEEGRAQTDSGQQNSETAVQTTNDRIMDDSVGLPGAEHVRSGLRIYPMQRVTENGSWRGRVRWTGGRQ